MPWRVIVLGDSAGDILTSTLVTDLAAPSQIADTSWIKPGRASWSWWAYPDKRNETEFYSSYITYAAKQGWEYSLLDAGWEKADIKALVEQATSDKVGLMVWSHANVFYDADRRKRRLDEFVRLGIRGVKIDFWSTDRQDALAAMEGTLRDAAERKLLVNFHGCTLPRGWQRTWPNFITAAAVLGAESFKFDERYPDKSAELATILPFTGNVAAALCSSRMADALTAPNKPIVEIHRIPDQLLKVIGIPAEEVVAKKPAGDHHSITIRLSLSIELHYDNAAFTLNSIQQGPSVPNAIAWET